MPADTTEPTDEPRTVLSPELLQEVLEALGEHRVTLAPQAGPQELERLVELERRASAAEDDINKLWLVCFGICFAALLLAFLL